MPLVNRGMLRIWVTFAGFCKRPQTMRAAQSENGAHHACSKEGESRNSHAAAAFDGQEEGSSEPRTAKYQGCGQPIAATHQGSEQRERQVANGTGDSVHEPEAPQRLRDRRWRLQCPPLAELGGTLLPESGSVPSIPEKSVASTTRQASSRVKSHPGHQ